MIYATLEALLFGGLLELRASYPAERWWTVPAIAINCVAVYLSLTRILWLACLLVLGLHLIWRRSKWIWALPVLPVIAVLFAPGPVRDRIAQSFQPGYYSNAERLQMWRVGWKMIQEKPLTGVGPGRVQELYKKYLAPEEPVPAYHGHLHNNALQLAAQFGLPILGAALVFLAALLRDLLHAYRCASDHESRFLCRSALLGITGYVAVGMMEYTYGHALGLILLCFVALAPLISARAGQELAT
jgi:O-antigen ligase